MIHDAYLSLDEALYPTKDGVAFPQYNKNQSAKYGLFRSINRTEMQYTCLIIFVMENHQVNQVNVI